MGSCYILLYIETFIEMLLTNVWTGVRCPPAPLPLASGLGGNLWRHNWEYKPDRHLRMGRYHI